MSDAKKCSHSTCTCLCTDGKKYCSQVCEDAAGTQTLACDCGHPSCGGHL